MKEIKINYDYYHTKTDSISMGIDYLRLSYSGGFYIYDYIWEWLDNDNSSFTYINICDIDIALNIVSCKGGWEWIQFSVSYNGKSVPIAIYREFHNKHIFDFYGSFYRLIDLEYISSDFIDNFLLYFNIDKSYCNISRVDYRLDFLMNTNCKVPHYNDIIRHNINTSNVRVWKKWQVLTNRQVWDKDSKSLVIRLYNKLLDTVKKNKDFLYFDYFRYNTVHRLEFECNLKFCYGYTYDNLDKLVAKIHSVFWINDEKWLQPIYHRYNKDKLVYTRKEIDNYMSYIRKGIDKLTYNYISSNINNELNPINIAIDYVLDSCKDNDILGFHILSSSQLYLNNRIVFYSKKVDEKILTH